MINLPLPSQWLYEEFIGEITTNQGVTEVNNAVHENLKI